MPLKCDVTILTQGCSLEQNARIFPSMSLEIRRIKWNKYRLPTGFLFSFLPSTSLKICTVIVFISGRSLKAQKRGFDN